MGADSGSTADTGSVGWTRSIVLGDPGILDGNRACAPASFLGDGYCDDGSYLGVLFDCTQLNNDNGDC